MLILSVTSLKILGVMEEKKNVILSSLKPVFLARLILLRRLLLHPDFGIGSTTKRLIRCINKSGMLHTIKITIHYGLYAQLIGYSNEYVDLPY